MWIEPVLSLFISMIAFGIGCYIVYQILNDKEKWDKFWESQNQQRPLAPKSWAGSPESKLLSYLVAIVLLLGGFMATISSIMNILKLAK